MQEEDEMDPVMEVKLWQEQTRIQEKILARKHLLLSRQQTKNGMDVEFETQPAVAPISLVSDDDNGSDDSEPTMDYPDAAAIPDATAIPVASPVPVATPADMNPAMIPIVPKTIQDLWQRIERMPPLSLESPRCACKQCPFSRGALMSQRYDLMLRLVILERQLYGI